MPLTTADLAWVRTEIGDDTPPLDADLDTIYDRVGTKEATAYEVLHKRWAALVNAPAQFSVSGQYPQNTQANIDALSKKLAELGATGATGIGGVTTIIPPPARPGR